MFVCFSIKIWGQTAYLWCFGSSWQNNVYNESGMELHWDPITDQQLLEVESRTTKDHQGSLFLKYAESTEINKSKLNAFFSRIRAGQTFKNTFFRKKKSRWVDNKRRKDVASTRQPFNWLFFVVSLNSRLYFNANLSFKSVMEVVPFGSAIKKRILLASGFFRMKKSSILFLVSDLK